jgi:hypothetical protein
MISSGKLFEGVYESMLSVGSPSREKPSESPTEVKAS